jgi:hypothetical protein
MRNHLIGALRSACFLAGAPFAAAVVRAVGRQKKYREDVFATPEELAGG